MKAAIYCRYSSRAQREESIEDQARNCQRIAQREGLEITETYSDAAISGSRSDRPAYQRMLVDAKSRRFDVLLVDDLSRLGRDQVESETAHRKLEHWGLRVISASDGYDSTSKARKVNRAVRGLMSEVYLDDLAEKTHRGLEGQARKSYWTGGRVFGYALVAEFDPVKRDPHGQHVRVGTRLEIDPTQAEVVRRIYTLYANGKSPRVIAGILNDDNTLPPRARRERPVWLASAIYGNPKLGTGILRNSTYRGVVTWNRSRWLKDPETGKRVYRLRNASEHIERDAPELRIVSEPLWSRVRERLAGVHAASSHIRAALHAKARTGRQPKYLLSGLLLCGQCGSRFVMNGTGKNQAYCCSTRVNGGKSACGNAFRVPRELAEHRLLEGIREALLEPKHVAQFEREVRKALREEQAAQRSGDKDRTARLAALDKQIGHLADAIGSGALRASPALAARLQAAEQERADLAARTEQRVTTVTQLVPNLAREYRRLVETLPTALQRDVDRARANLRTLLGSVRLVPHASGRFLVAEGEMQIPRLLEATGAIRKCGSGGLLRLFQVAHSPPAQSAQSAVRP